MKKMFFFILAVLTTIITFTACKNKNPIWDRKPVDTTFAASFPLDQFHHLGEAGDTIGQKALVNKYKKQLTKNIMSHYPCVTNEKNVLFVFGSGRVDKVLSGDGKTYGGKFKNELIIMVNDPCVKDTVFLACGNGMLSSIHWTNQSNWGTAEKCRFVVKEGQSLAYFLPKLNDWGVKAKDLGLPIANEDRKIVNEKVYLKVVGEWWSDHLFPGDIIDLCSGTITNSSGQKVNFKLRQKATNSANIETKNVEIEKIKSEIEKISSIKAKSKFGRKEIREKLVKLNIKLTILQSKK